MSIKSPYQDKHPLPPALTLAVAYARQLQSFKHSFSQPSKFKLSLTRAVDASGGFTPTSIRALAPLTPTRPVSQGPVT